MENEFEKQGIQFKIITAEMFPAVVDFMWKNFFPDEPINRSLNISQNWYIDELYLIDAMKDGTSIAALDKDGKIIGARIGMRKRRSDWTTWIFEKMMLSLPTRVLLYMMPKEMQQIPVFLKFIDMLEYDVWQMFGKLKCELIYEDKAVCSSRESVVEQRNWQRN